jgi:hypothetical protein
MHELQLVRRLNLRVEKRIGNRAAAGLWYACLVWATSRECAMRGPWGLSVALGSTSMQVKGRKGVQPHRS